MNFKAAAFLVGTVLLAACGDGGGGETNNFTDSAETLRNAASQSTPEAREVLLNAANQVESGNVQTPVGAPGSPVQEAMEKAGQAQAQQPQGQQAPPPVQAIPRKPGDPAPPNKTMPQQP